MISNSTAIFQKVQNLPKANKSKQTNKQNLANSVQDIWRETNRLSARKYIILEYEFWLKLKTQCKDKIFLNCRILISITIYECVTLALWTSLVSQLKDTLCCEGPCRIVGCRGRGIIKAFQSYWLSKFDPCGREALNSVESLHGYHFTRISRSIGVSTYVTFFSYIIFEFSKIGRFVNKFIHSFDYMTLIYSVLKGYTYIFRL